MSRLLFPELAPEDVAVGWLPGAPKVTTDQVLSAVARRHPMDGLNGMPGRWVFVREVLATTGAWGEQQRFDAVAVGLVPSVKHARVVYEAKISRADWLRELRPMAEVTFHSPRGRRRLYGAQARVVLRDRRAMPEYDVVETRKWAAALAVSTEFWIAAPPRCVLPGELPPEAGLLEVRHWGPFGELRARVVRPAPVRETPNPDAGFWAAVLRRAAERKP